jgi:dTDP-4-dehydrorhamnose 3,5-epimerase
MEVIATAIQDVKLVRPRAFLDERGWFAEVFNRGTFAHLGLPHDFIQENQAFSPMAGTLRGLHWQAPPFAQSKLVRVGRGAALDVAVDLRPGSLTFGRHVAVELSAENRLQLLVPKGFAHGFLTLVPATDVVYRVDGAYAPDHERGVHYADPDLAIVWPDPPGVRLVLARDRALPSLRELPPC